MKQREYYSEADWENADPIDKLHIHLVDPARFALTYEQDEKLEALRKVWAIMCKKSTNRERIKKISMHIDVTERTVQRYINDAKELFGDILAVDTELEYSLAYERFMRLYDRALDSKDFETARRCQDNALAVLERIEANAPKKKKSYPAITFTSDPIALRARNEGEFIEHEPVRILEQEAVELLASH